MSNCITCFWWLNYSKKMLRIFPAVEKQHEVNAIDVIDGYNCGHDHDAIRVECRHSYTHTHTHTHTLPFTLIGYIVDQCRWSPRSEPQLGHQATPNHTRTAHAGHHLSRHRLSISFPDQEFALEDETRKHFRSTGYEIIRNATSRMRGATVRSKADQYSSSADRRRFRGYTRVIQLICSSGERDLALPRTQTRSGRCWSR